MAYEPPALRQMTVADLIDSSIRLYRRNFGAILGISAIVQVPSMALIVSAQHFMMRQVMAVETQEFPVEQFALGFGVVMIAGLVMGLLYPLGQAALTIGISERYLGRPITVSGSYARAVRHWLRVLWTTILFGLALYGVMVACIVPVSFMVPVMAQNLTGGVIGALLAFGAALVGVVLMVLLGVRYMLGPATVPVLEDTGGTRALGRSWALTGGYFWHVFGILALLYLLVWVISAGVAAAVQVPMVLLMAKGPETLMSAQLIYMIAMSAVSIVLQPVPLIAVVLLYYDLRIRKEGFDLMMMAEALGHPTEQYAPESAAPLYPQTAAPQWPSTAPPPPDAMPQAPEAPAAPPSIPPTGPQVVQPAAPPPMPPPGTTTPKSAAAPAAPPPMPPGQKRTPSEDTDTEQE